MATIAAYKSNYSVKLWTGTEMYEEYYGEYDYDSDDNILYDFNLDKFIEEIEDDWEVL
jgi:hypothetical protein